MSYSIMTPFVTVAERDNMLEFLKLNFRPYPDLRGDSKQSSVVPTTQLSYGLKRDVPVIGFNYGAGDTDGEIHYAFILSYFMALHGGAKIIHRGESVPFIVYDGCENWLIYHDIKDVTNTAIEHVITDTVGFSPRYNFFTRKLPKFIKEKMSAHNRIVKAEVQRLSRLV